ncbi:MAG: mannose-1-phosphate guanylyltransferase/mannose-6-phosphate isomerase [Deltaproteobacteria bacterium]|nr:MAG: mannose-1-phosphate guanylyltransferase/mannose-6-phosphate isomerase [Deltaproteobacteria bacterium]PIE74688.1 MAG: mannose-1-phosphate guanylyltransferase/mannose-6-phosphate isomerase [Deltaproteobacteria bacterium]
MLIPVILAGGSGTRLWPLSRRLYPKQLIELISDKTMLQETVARLDDIDELGNPVIICNEDHRFMVAEQMLEMGIKNADIILEPVGKNTAPAVAVAALKTLNEYEDASVLILPADHYIGDVESFTKSITLGYEYSKQNLLITFGIVPESPETGYGYIQKGEKLHEGIFKTKNFKEKPDLETAKKYLESQKYLWNSGMFIFNTKTILNEFEKSAPEILDYASKAFEKGQKDLDFLRLDKDNFKKCPENSIDYAIMEKTDKSAVIPISCKWNDLGSFEALWKVRKKDENNNVLIGDIYTSDVKNSYLYSSSRMVAAVGLEEHVVIETSDAVLVAPRKKVQEVKKIVQKLKKDKRNEPDIHKKVYRPWGNYETIDISDRFQVKRLTVKPGEKLSAQKHHHRAEHWVVVKGTAVVTRGEDEILLKEDESIYIPLGTMHRLFNPGKIPLEIVEVQSGSYLGEDDIVRFDDIYGR